LIGFLSFLTVIDKMMMIPSYLPSFEASPLSISQMDN